MPDQDTLWRLTAASGPLAERFLLDEATCFPLDRLLAGSTLDASRAALADRCVFLHTTTQLATALALLELDGLARRIVLAIPGLPPEQLAHAVATAEATMVVSDLPGPAGVTQVRSSGAATRPASAKPDRGRPTEWVLFTSGTTGPPKLALHTLQSLIAPIPPHNPAAPAAARQVWSTFYDTRRYGGLQILLRALTGGGSMVLSGTAETPAAWLMRAGAAGVTFMSGTPTHWRRALLTPQAASIAPADVRLSGEVADQPILDKLRAAYPGAAIRHAFASTEAGVAFEVADGRAGFPASWIGHCPNGVELAVQDETLRIRSPRTASRYLGEHDPPLRQADGWVDTKDVVEPRGGRAYFVGRRDGVINVGGQKVHPEEVEAIVNRHPRVAMSRVSARRNPITGAVVVVDVVMRAPAAQVPAIDAGALQAEILAACRGSLAAYKVPALVRLVPSLDVSAAGKLIR